MQIVSNGDNLHEMLNPVFWENQEKIFQIVVCWKFYPEYEALIKQSTQQSLIIQEYHHIWSHKGIKQSKFSEIIRKRQQIYIN